MKEKSSLNKLMPFIGILSFILGLIPTIDIELRMILLIISPLVLVFAAFSIFLSNQDEIKERLEETEESIKKMTDMIDLKSRVLRLENKKR